MRNYLYYRINENLFRDIDQFLFYLISIGCYAYSVVWIQDITLLATHGSFNNSPFKPCKRMFMPCSLTCGIAGLNALLQITVMSTVSTEVNAY